MYQLEVKSVGKSFETGKAILQDVNFAVNKGEFLVILGPSGCGKTTLLRIIAGLETPDAGQIFIGGRDVTTAEPKSRDIAMVFQNYALYPHMSVYENLAFALKVRKLPKTEIESKVTEAARMLGLAEYLNRKPKQLSGGQRQRVALGRAIVRKPALFLFDEPLSNLDAELRSQMRFELLALHRQLGATSIYVTHDQIEAMSLADNIVILNKGEQIGPAKPRELYDNPPNQFVAGFLGNPGMNLLEAVVGQDGKSIVIDNQAIAVLEQNRPAGDKIIYGFRPEHCYPADNGMLCCKVTGVEDSGKEYILKLNGPNNTKIYCMNSNYYNVGSEIKLHITQSCIFKYEDIR